MRPILAAMTKWRPVFGLALVALALAASPAAQAGGKRLVVVELYTSQGCSSCPPADALLGRLADRKDVLAMSLPVTYWDMLGWKDTLASETNTHRQKAYAVMMGRGNVYTPQMIVDGVSDVVGSREAAVDAAIAARQADMIAVPVMLQANSWRTAHCGGPRRCQPECQRHDLAISNSRKGIGQYRGRRRITAVCSPIATSCAR